MPLSEEEIRLLEQMERALAAEDPKFVNTIRGTSVQRAARRRAFAAGAVVVVGMAVLLLGAATSQIWLGVVGFVLMLAAAVAGLTAWKSQNSTPAPAQQQAPGPEEAFGLNLVQGGRSARKRKAPKQPRGTSSRRPARPSGSFMQRMEQRWQRRRDTGGF